MKRRSKLQKEIASKATLSASAAREAKRANTTSAASSDAAPVDSGTDPPPAGRFRRSCRTPTAQVQPNRPLRLLPLLRTARWRLAEGHATVRPSAPPAGKPRARAAALSLPMCAPMRTHARTSCTRLRCGAGCFGGFCCTDRALHVGRAAACLAGPAAVCLPLHPPVACARARSIAASTRPLSAARRCRSGCERQRC